MPEASVTLNLKVTVVFSVAFETSTEVGEAVNSGNSGASASALPSETYKTSRKSSKSQTPEPPTASGNVIGATGIV
mgnify:CR=1 FL=1